MSSLGVSIIIKARTSLIGHYGGSIYDVIDLHPLHDTGDVRRR